MNRTISKIIDYAARVAEPEKIILFGSLANGRDNAFSDVDLLIVSENSSMKNDIIAMIKSYSRELSLKADVLVYSESEIEKIRHTTNSIVTAILTSGKIVFENKKTLILKKI